MKIRQKLTKILGVVLILLLALGVNVVAPKTAKALSWTQVNSNGFGVPGNWGTIRLHVFNNYMYAGTGNDAGAQIYRSSDGTTWEPVTTDGFEDADNQEIHAFATFNGAIYAATLRVDLPVPSPTGVEIWSSTTGAAGSWSQVNADGFADNNNRAGRAMAAYGSYLYVGCDNIATGAEVWRTSDGTTWTPANTDGFGAAVTGIRALKVYKGSLYAGGGAAGGSVIYRTPDGTTWSQVASGGFGDSNNSNNTFLEYFGSNLYAGTINDNTGAELWRSSTGDSGTWTQANSDGFGTATNTWVSYQGAVVNNVFWLGTRTAGVGARLYYSTDGTNWTQEGQNGFEDPNNYALYAVNFDESLYVGFSNASTGTEIWRSQGLTLLSLSPSSLPSGTVGSSYNVSLQGNSGTPPYIFICGPEIPAGTVIYPEFREGGVTADGYGSGPDGGNGGVIANCNVPPGVTFNYSGVISGTPTQQGDYRFSVLLVDSGTPRQYTYRNYTLSVSVARSVLPETGASSSPELPWALGGLACLQSTYLILNSKKKKRAL